MNDRRRLPAPSATINVTSSEGSNTRRRAPALQLTVALEELPVIRLVADTHEDEYRMRKWLASPAARRRLLDGLLDGLDDLAA